MGPPYTLQVFNSTPGPDPLDASSSSSPCDNPNCPHTLPRDPWGPNRLTGNHWARGGVCPLPVLSLGLNQEEEDLEAIEGRWRKGRLCSSLGSSPLPETV